MTEAEQIMKRCQAGTRNYEEANNLHAACYGIIGKLLAQRKPLTEEESRAKFEAWYSSAPDASEPERIYELTDESMTELTKDCLWLGWQAAHDIKENT